MKKPSRNGHAFHPIMGKGGVHQKSNKAQRQQDRQEFKRKINKWLAKGADKTADDSAVFLYFAGSVNNLVASA